MKCFLIIVTLGLILMSCGGSDPIESNDSTTYNIVKIDGMTCVKWSGVAYTSGLTCNWDEWKGEAR